MINTSTAKLSDKIDASTKTIVSNVKAGFVALADYVSADAKVNKAQLLKNINMLAESSEELQKNLAAKFAPFVAKMREAIELTKDVNKAQAAFLGAQLSIYIAEVLVETAKMFNPFAQIFGTTDPVRLAQAVANVASTTAEIAKLAAASDLFLKAVKDFNETVKKLSKIADDFKKVQGSLAKITEAVTQLGNTDTAVDETKSAALVDALLDLYNNFDCPITQTDLNTAAYQTGALIDAMSNFINTANVGVGPKTLAALKSCKDQAQPIFSLYNEIYGELNKQFEVLGQAARAAVNVRAADHLSTVANNMEARRLRRRLQTTTSSFKPLYSMAYAGVSKLFMQYKVQQAALQFCNYYAYKLGGTAPSMCGSAKFYTPTDIQKMRAYQPPSFKATSITALLPTRPTAAGDDKTNGVVTPRPFLDLEKLLNGETFSFALPIADLAWLKTYNWMLRTDTDASVAGVYVQSMQIVLPFTSTTNASTRFETFDMVSTVTIASTQCLNAKSDKTYLLPQSRLHFTSAINAQFCSNEITNPYHSAAKCVKSDGSSSLCVYEEGDVARTDILPSLFSLWEIAMPRDGSANVGSDYKIALPSASATNAVDLNVVALLKVVRMAATPTAAVAKADSEEAIGLNADPVCCAADEYFVRSACVKCPTGSTGALNGYSCQRM